MSEGSKIDDSLQVSDSESDDRDFLSDSDDDEDEEHMEEDEVESDEEDDGKGGANGGHVRGANGENHDDEDDDEEEEEDEGMEAEAELLKKRTYIPAAGDEMNPEELEFDETAYIMYHKAESGYPCLSFDIIPDSDRSPDRSVTYPQTVYLVAGTQAPQVHANKLLVMKMSNLTRMKEKKKKRKENGETDDEDDEDEAEEEVDEENGLQGEDDPKLLSAQIPHDGVVNRVRSVTLGATQVAATWSESGRVDIWDLTKQLAAVEDQKTNDLFNKLKKVPRPIFSFKGHQQEGYAMDWSQVAKGYLATGDCNKRIHVWTPQEAFSWRVDQKPLIGHTDSVEDIQWSPTEHNILASCSVDKSIRVWDIRAAPSKACVVTLRDAHDSDVNVISWNRLEAAFLLSGGDDGTIKTWDLRQCVSSSASSASGGGGSGSSNSSGSKASCKTSSPQAIAVFKHHTSPVTSIEWHPTDSTVFAASGDDNQITLWDLAVEKDDDEEDDEEEDQGRGESSGGEASGGSSKENDMKIKDDEDDEAQIKKLPPQLLFIHQGSSEVKELHWHPHIPGLVISTAINGFDVFRTISV